MSAGALAWPSAAGAAMMRDDPDAEFVAAAKAGDVSAFSQLVLRHQRVAYNLAYRFMRNTTLAEDMTQEAFLKAFRLLNGFRGDCSFATWIYRVTCSVCLTEIERRKRRGEVELQPQHDRAETPPTPGGGDDESEAIRRCVNKLPANYAQAVTLYYLKEIPYEEIAEIMQVPMGTLKTWLHRARQQLRDIVEKELGTHDVFG